MVAAEAVVVAPAFDAVNVVVGVVVVVAVVVVVIIAVVVAIADAFVVVDTARTNRL